MTEADDARALRNMKRRVERARDFPNNTCPASRHLHIIALALADNKPYAMLHEEPEHCAGTMLMVLESLWKARSELKRLRGTEAVTIEEDNA